MDVRTSLKIDKELLKKVKHVSFDNDLTQNEVIIKYIEYCINNEVSI